MRRGLAVVMLSLLAAACATQPAQPTSQRDPSVDFAKFRTFGWLPAGGAAAGQALPLLDQDLRAAISAELNRRGYVLAAEKPDLFIAYETSSEQKVGGSPVHIGIGVGGWSGNVGGSVSVGSPVLRRYKEGSLVIHAVDAARNAEVWVGQGDARLGKAGGERAAIFKAVGLVMKDFPARAGGR